MYFCPRLPSPWTTRGQGADCLGTRRNLLRNSLVLIAPLDSRLTDFDGASPPAIRTHCSGRSGQCSGRAIWKSDLASLHLLDKLNAKLVLAKDVRQVLTYVETGNADAGLVYATDAMTSSKVRVVAMAPNQPRSHRLSGRSVRRAAAAKQAARRFVDFLDSSRRASHLS